MTTGHEHALLVHLNIITAHSAKWRFKFTINFLTMFLFNLYNWKSVNSFLFRSLSSLSPLSFFFTDSSNCFEDIIRCEILVIVLHKASWVKVSILWLHSGELASREYVQKAAEQIIYYTLNIACKPLLVWICSFRIIRLPWPCVWRTWLIWTIRSMSEYKLRSWHLNTANLYIMKSW